MIMEVRTIFLLLIFSFSSFDAFSAKLMLPENFRVLKINGEEKSFGFLALSSSVELQKGRNIIELQYRELFEGDEDDTIKVMSLPIIIALDSNAPENLILDAPMFELEEPARVYAKSPDFKIVNEAGDLVAFSTLDAEKVLMSDSKNISSYSDFSDSGSTPNYLATDNMNRNSVTPEDVDSLKLLKFWWQQASEHEKHQFMDFIKAKQEEIE